MSANPVEGRLSPEAQAERLQEARKRTGEMKREYRSMRHEKFAKEKADKWAAKHKRAHTEAYEQLDEGKFDNGRAVIRLRHPMNRRTRRSFAKKLNVYKTSGGWKHFNNHYAKKFGKMEPIDRSKVAREEYKSNMAQAMEAAKVTPGTDTTKVTVKKEGK